MSRREAVASLCGAMLRTQNQAINLMVSMDEAPSWYWTIRPCLFRLKNADTFEMRDLETVIDNTAESREMAHYRSTLHHLHELLIT